ncbi:Flp pilus assembly complex ATPase component TadA [Candidatus Microgenomates bacterium]|nr:Flp pilus assembly complex ATPase component TadA [Candidatus Microgenomates bacterium]
MDGGIGSLADFLLSSHRLTADAYAAARLESANSGKPIEQVLVEKNLVSSQEISQARAKLLGVAYLDIETEAIDPTALTLVPEPVARRYVVLPFKYNKDANTLHLAMSDPSDLEAIEFVRQKAGTVVIPFAADPQKIIKIIDEQYRQDIVKEVSAAIAETQLPKSQIRTIEQQELSSIIKEAPIARIVSTVLEYAIKSRASDVHIEPQDDRTRVRYRIDGILHERLTLPQSVHDALASRIKILSGMKIDEHRIPQDGRFNFKVGEEEVDLRVSSLPTMYGEKIVMRLLRKSAGVPTLNELGLNGTALKNLETAMLRPHGIIIVCGPTGSGKTTTLYSVLSKINTTKVNVSTLEDPVEYQIAGVNQVQINPAVGLTFATGLRAFLRQDPNVILVGEIRDRETTDLAIQAALTGHLVFSTLHTSNASGVLPRMIDLGAESFLLASTMTAALGQRIVRKICPDCKESYAPPASVLDDVKKVLGKLLPERREKEIKFSKGKGCASCGNTGYLGRIGIFEVLPVSEKIARLVLEKADANTLEHEAIAEGMVTMKQDGYLKVLEGITTIEEVLRVAQE